MKSVSFSAAAIALTLALGVGPSAGAAPNLKKDGPPAPGQGLQKQAKPGKSGLSGEVTTLACKVATMHLVYGAAIGSLRIVNTTGKLLKKGAPLARTVVNKDGTVETIAFLLLGDLKPGASFDMPVTTHAVKCTVKRA